MVARFRNIATVAGGGGRIQQKKCEREYSFLPVIPSRRFLSLVFFTQIILVARYFFFLSSSEMRLVYHKTNTSATERCHDQQMIAVAASTL